MRVVICGAGRVGYGIAKRLSEEDAEVTIIDQSATLVRNVTERLDVRGVVGSGSYPDTLQEAGAREADMLIAVTHSDEVNIVACQICHSVFSVPTKIARIRAASYLDTKYADLFSRTHIPIDVIISPEREVAEAVLQRLTMPGAFEIKSFVNGRVMALGVSLDDSCPILETPLSQVAELFPELAITIVGVHRKEKIFRPHADDQLLAGDDIYFVTDRTKADRALQILGQTKTRARRVVLVGGGNIGLYVASALEKLGSMKVRIVEQDVTRAGYVAEQLQRTVVINGSGLDRDILREAGVNDAETLVALTDSDEVNVLSSVIGKREGARRSMVLINEPDYAALSKSVGVDRFIDPRSTTISTILQHVRRGRIKSVFSILDGQAELVDAVALETSGLVGEPLAEVGLPSGVMIGAIVRDDDIILPDSQTVIQANDRVILMTLRENIKDVEQLFRVSLEYF